MPTLPTDNFSNRKLEFASPSPGAVTMAVNLQPGTYVRGQRLGEVTATPGLFGPFDTAAVDGRQTVRAIMMYACVVIAGGFITGIDEVTSGNDRDVPALFANATLRTADLPGLTTGEVTALGRLMSGSLTNGLLRLY